MGKPESAVETYFKKEAEKRGFFCRKMTAIGHNGFPDRVIIGHGLTVFVELKAPGRTTQKIQKVTIREMISHGALVFVIDTKQEVDRLLDHLMTFIKSDTHKTYEQHLNDIKKGDFSK